MYGRFGSFHKAGRWKRKGRHFATMNSPQIIDNRCMINKYQQYISGAELEGIDQL